MIRLYDITIFNDFILPAHPARPLRWFFCKFQLDFLLFLEGRGDLQWIPGCVTLAVFQVVGLLTFHAKIFIVSQFYYLYEYDISPIFALPWFSALALSTLFFRKTHMHHATSYLICNAQFVAATVENMVSSLKIAFFLSLFLVRNFTCNFIKKYLMKFKWFKCIDEFRGDQEPVKNWVHSY